MLHVALGIPGRYIRTYYIYILEIHGFVRHGFVLSQETLWKMASAGCYAWKIRAAVRIPAVPVAGKNGSVSCTDVELFSMVSIF